MDNIELVDIYKILLNMQSDIHKLDKKTDVLSQELKDTKIGLTHEFNKKFEQTKTELRNEISQTKEELQLSFENGLSKNLKETADFMKEDIFPHINLTHEKKIRGLEEFSKTRGYTMVSDIENNYNYK